MDDFESNEEYLDNVEGTCHHVKDDAKECDGCGDVNCCVTEFDCSFAGPPANLCLDCKPYHYGCPECG